MEETIRMAMGDLFSRLDETNRRLDESKRRLEESNRRRDQAKRNYDQTLKELRQQSKARFHEWRANTDPQMFITLPQVEGQGFDNFEADISNFIRRPTPELKQSNYSPYFSNFTVELRSLKQGGMVSDYINHFKTLLAKVEINESYAVHLFVSGLHHHIQNSVRMFEPKSLVHAFALARLQESALNFRGSYCENENRKEDRVREAIFTNLEFDEEKSSGKEVCVEKNGGNDLAKRRALAVDASGVASSSSKKVTTGDAGNLGGSIVKDSPLLHTHIMPTITSCRLLTSEEMGCDKKLKQLYQLELEEDVIEGKISEYGKANEGEGSECGKAIEEGNIGDEAMEGDKVQWPEILGDIHWNLKNLTTDFMLEGTRYELSRGYKEQRISTMSENEFLTQCNGAPANQQSTSALSTDKTEISVVNEELNGLVTAWDESRWVTELTETFTRLSERLSGLLSESQSKIMSAKFFDQVSDLLEGSFMYDRFSEVRKNLLSLLERRQKSGVASQIRDLSQKLVDIIDEAQRSVSPPLFDLSERLRTTLQDLENQLDLIVQYDWDFDHYMKEDVSAAIEYIRAQSKPKDGWILAIGHSMGRILLYAMLARYSLERRDFGSAAVVPLASSLDYSSSKSSLKLLIHLAVAQALMSSSWSDFFTLQGVELHVSTACHPQLDGQTEMVSRCWGTCLRYMCGYKSASLGNSMADCSKLLHRRLFFKLLEVVLDFGNCMNGQIESAPHKIEEPKHRTERVFRVFKGMFQPFVEGNRQILNLEGKVN